jgi:hypothetical protein
MSLRHPAKGEFEYVFNIYRVLRSLCGKSYVFRWTEISLLQNHKQKIASWNQSLRKEPYLWLEGRLGHSTISPLLIPGSDWPVPMTWLISYPNIKQLRPDIPRFSPDDKGPLKCQQQANFYIMPALKKHSQHHILICMLTGLGSVTYHIQYMYILHTCTCICFVRLLGAHTQ